MSPEEIVGQFPQLTIADVHAALMYYHDNRELLDGQDRQARELVDQLTSRVSFQTRSPFRQGWLG